VFSLPKKGKQRRVALPESVGLRLSAHIAEHGTRAVTPWGTPGGEPVTVELMFVARQATPYAYHVQQAVAFGACGRWTSEHTGQRRARPPAYCGERVAVCWRRYPHGG
jgi:hypothetical protein